MELVHELDGLAGRCLLDDPCVELGVLDQVVGEVVDSAEDDRYAWEQGFSMPADELQGVVVTHDQDTDVVPGILRCEELDQAWLDLLEPVALGVEILDVQFHVGSRPESLAERAIEVVCPGEALVIGVQHDDAAVVPGGGGHGGRRHARRQPADGRGGDQGEPDPEYAQQGPRGGDLKIPEAREDHARFASPISSLDVASSSYQARSDPVPRSRVPVNLMCALLWCHRLHVSAAVQMTCTAAKLLLGTRIGFQSDCFMEYGHRGGVGLEDFRLLASRRVRPGRTAPVQSDWSSRLPGPLAPRRPVTALRGIERSLRS